MENLSVESLFLGICVNKERICGKNGKAEKNCSSIYHLEGNKE